MMAHTTPATHRMLQIPHLLEEVFNHLAPETRRDSCVGHVSGSRASSSNSRRTEKDGHCALARSARVCKVFADPALDVLWRELDDLLVLLRILPPFQPYTAHYFVSHCLLVNIRSSLPY